MTTLETRPSAPDLRPLSTCCSTIVGAPSAVAMRHPSLRDSYGFSTKCPQKRGIPWEQGSPTSEIAEPPQASVSSTSLAAVGTLFLPKGGLTCNKGVWCC